MLFVKATGCSPAVQGIGSVRPAKGFRVPIGEGEMQGLIEHFKSPEFWILSVCLAMVLNVAANYATRVLDRTFSVGSTWLRSISMRSREKRAARAKLMTDWIDSHENGIMLALSEAHFTILVGLIFCIAFILGALVALSLNSTTVPIANPIIIGLFMTAFGIIGMAAMSFGSDILDVVRAHPKGLKGLHPSQGIPPTPKEE
jgi:hypothetical protein